METEELGKQLHLGEAMWRLALQLAALGQGSPDDFQFPQRPKEGNSNHNNNNTFERVRTLLASSCEKGQNGPQSSSETARFLPVLKAPLSMTKTKTPFSLETSVHVHFCCVAFLSCSALPSGRESLPGQDLLRLRHELVRGCQVCASNPAEDSVKKA